MSRRYYAQERHIQTFNSLSDRYLRHGDNRPPANFLKAASDKLVANGRDTSMLLAADMYIDLAMQSPESSRSYLSRAENATDEILEQARYIRDKQPAGMRQIALWAVTARLKKSELPKWQDAANGKSAVESFHRSLTAATEAADFAEGHGNAQAYLVEYIPVLLGARQAERGHPMSWTGRLPLAREEQRILQADGENANWDLGITPSLTTRVFDSPAAKFQVKTSYNKNSGQYMRGGVHMLNARACGFNEPARIIFSCLQEAGDDVPEHDMQLYCSDQLDEVSDKINNRISEVFSAA